MSFLQPWMLLGLPLIALPILIHLINQWRYQTQPWGAMMFLLAANRMNRGFAKLRQWLILAARTLAVAGLVFAIARPLSSGFLAMTGGGRADTTILIVDRSPSMQQAGVGGLSKLESGRSQLADALATLGSAHWVAIDPLNAQPLTFETLDSMIDSNVFEASSAASDLPKLLQSALDYLQTNKPGPTEIWICSDLRQADWSADSGTWSVVRDGFEQLPQSVRFHLLAYPEPPADNLAIRVTDAKRMAATEDGVSANELLLSLQVSRSAADASQQPVSQVPIQIVIEGARSELTVELTGAQTEIKNHRVALPANRQRGWGRVSLPADENNADNDFYFVFDDPPVRRVVLVSEDRAATRALEIAASVGADGSDNAQVEVLAPQQLDSLALAGASLLIWQTALPGNEEAPAIDNYVAAGGQVLFLPPTQLIQGGLAETGPAYHDVRWTQWIQASPDANAPRVMVENWRSDQDLLAATASGAGLPVGQLELSGYARLESPTPLTQLATLSGGDALLARLPTSRGGVYFCAASADPQTSTLAESGIVLFVAIQRAIERGQESLGNTLQRVAGQIEEATDVWQQVSGPAEALSTEFASTAGIYQADDRLFAINRPAAEDQRDVLPDSNLEQLFAGLAFSRVDASAGNLSGIVREVWRLFLILMIVALLTEAALCLPRFKRRRAVPATAAREGFA